MNGAGGFILVIVVLFLLVWMYNGKRHGEPAAPDYSTTQASPRTAFA